jgi:hypothetical protein
MNPMEKIKKLREAIDKAISDMDLERVSFTIIPGENGVPDTAAMLLKVKGDIFKSAEQRQIDSAFDELVLNIDAFDDAKKKLDNLKGMISDWMDEDGTDL